MSGANSINFNRTPVVLRIRHWYRWIVREEIHSFHPILFYSIPSRRCYNYCTRPSSHKSRHGGSACATLWRDMWLVARIEVLLRHCFGSASGLSLAMWAPKRDLCHFVGKTTKSPKEKKAFPSPDFGVTHLGHGMRESWPAAALIERSSGRLMG